MEYRNPPTVVVGLVPINTSNESYSRIRNGLLVVRRKLADGYGKLALPGGYQEEGETWQEALDRELTEETDGMFGSLKFAWHLINVVTVQNGKINLLFAERRSIPMYNEDAFPLLVHDNSETLEVDVIFEPTELAFPAHTAEADAWFRRKALYNE